MYLWSAGGADYARDTALELGLLECFVGFLPKPNLVVDDQPFSEWATCEHLYPMQVP